MSDLFRGLSAPFRAIALLAKYPRLRKLAALPLLVNIVLFAVGVPLAVWLLAGWAGGLVPDDGVVQGAFRVLVQIVVGIAVIVGSVFTFVIVGNIIAAPFNSRLSEAVEQQLTGRVASGSGVVGDALRGVLTAAGRLGLFLLLYPFIFAVQFVPVAGVFLHPVLAALYGAFVLSIDFSDPTFERHYRRFRDKIAHVWRRKGLYLGFGLVAVVMAIIPIVNFLLLPVGVTAAAMLFLEDRSAGRGRE